MDDFLPTYGLTAKTALGFFWKAGWASVLGYAISATIQVSVPKARLAPKPGEANPKSIGLSTIFGTISSSCSFAALAAARSLILKGAHFICGVPFMFPSTNLEAIPNPEIVLLLVYHAEIDPGSTPALQESRRLPGVFDFMLTEDSPEPIIGDKAYDSDALDAEMAEQGIEMIAPHRSNRKPENVTQDGRPLRRYARRWTVERTISRIQNFRRLCIRWGKSTKQFQGLLHFEYTMLLIKVVLG